MQHTTILTFDIGTTGLKCSLFDSSCTEIASAVAGYPTALPQPGWAEQHPADYWDAAVRACRQLFSGGAADPRGVAVIGLSGQMNGCLAVDAAGVPLYPGIIHSDGRSESQCRLIAANCTMDSFFELTGNRIDSHFSLPKMLWIKDELPGLYRETRWFLNAKDWLRGRLTGDFGLTDWSDASLTCCLDIHGRRWADGLLRELGLDPSRLPRLRAANELAGTLAPDAAAALGLPAGVPVATGGGDAACATRGAGLEGPGRAYVNLGSSAWISVLAEAPYDDPGHRIQNFYDLDGHSCNVCATVQNASSAVDWTMATLGIASFAELPELVMASRPGAGGLLFLPYLMGERSPHWNPQARGAFIGLSLHHGRADLLRAVLEGVAFGLRDALDIYGEGGFGLTRLTILGGGARHLAWHRILADVLGVELVIHPQALGASGTGAALAAGQAVGLFPSMEWPLRVREEDVIRPDPAGQALYRDWHQVFRQAYRGLEPIFPRCSAGLTE